MYMKSKTIAIVFTLSVVASVISLGCARTKPNDAAQTTAASTPAPSPQRIAVGDLAKLRWIEGTWRGTGDVETPFYERYYFANDSTLVVEGLADETASKVTDVTRFELKDGEFGNKGDAGSVATDLRKGSVTFSPLGKARNTFRFERNSDNLWTAVLTWPATATKAAGQRVYHMERLQPAKKQ